jgi:glycosidase
VEDGRRLPDLPAVVRRWLGGWIGDLGGIIDHLDHLAGTPDSLGVDAIWLSPIHPSPGHDLGYDISDYASVDPLFETDADFDRLVAEAHRRGSLESVVLLGG